MFCWNLRYCLSYLHKFHKTCYSKYGLCTKTCCTSFTLEIVEKWRIWFHQRLTKGRMWNLIKCFLIHKSWRSSSMKIKLVKQSINTSLLFSTHLKNGSKVIRGRNRNRFYRVNMGQAKVGKKYTLQHEARPPCKIKHSGLHWLLSFSFCCAEIHMT